MNYYGVRLSRMLLTTNDYGPKDLGWIKHLILNDMMKASLFKLRGCLKSNGTFM